MGTGIKDAFSRMKISVVFKPSILYNISMKTIEIKIKTSDRELYQSLVAAEDFTQQDGISLKFKEATVNKEAHYPEIIIYALEVVKSLPAHIIAGFVVDWLRNTFKHKEADVSIKGKTVRTKKTQVTTKDIEVIIEETIKETH
jgi:hypothetical protein